MSLFYTFHFYLFGVLAIASSLAFVTRKSPVSAALWLVTTMFCLAAEYVLLGAHFIGAIQVLVYAGAIMVVFLFVVMLLNLGQPGDFPPPDFLDTQTTKLGAVGTIAQPLFTDYLLAFELTSILLLAAIVGAV